MISKQSEKKQDNVRYKSFCSILLAVLCYCFSSWSIGYGMVYFNSIDYDVIHDLYNIQLEKGEGEGILSGCITFGSIFGCVFSSSIIKFFSRKHCFYFNNALKICSVVLILNTSFSTLLIGRILQGICGGIDSAVVPIMIKEYTPVVLNGELGALQNSIVGLGYVFGFLVSLILSQFFQPEFFYFFVFGLPLLTILLQQILLMTTFTSETPKYLLVKGRNEEAKELIASIYKQEYCETIYHQKLRDLQADNPNLEGGEKQYPKDSCIATFLAFSFNIFQQLVGISILNLYGIELGKQFFPSVAPFFGFFINLVKTVSASLSVLILKRIGRRPLLLRGVFVIALSLLILYFGYEFHDQNSSVFGVFIIGGFFLYISAFAMSLGPLGWIYPTEVVAPSLIPFATMAKSTTSCLLITIFPMIREHASNKNIPFMYLVFFIFAVIKIVICWKFMVETKGKTEVEIREDFNMICN